MIVYVGGECVICWGMLVCELCLVNYWFLEVGVCLFEELCVLELQLCECVVFCCSCGKIDLVVCLCVLEVIGVLVVNDVLLVQLGELFWCLVFGFFSLQVSFIELLQVLGVMQGEVVDVVVLQVEVLVLLDIVLDGFVVVCECEGDKLVMVIQECVDGVECIVVEVIMLILLICEGQCVKLLVCLVDLLYLVDFGCVEQELVLWLQKLDVDEELDCFGSYIVEICCVLMQCELVGCCLDFLLQEFNCEVNMLGFKFVDSCMFNVVVELKVLIDQICEQVQNIE